MKKLELIGLLLGIGSLGLGLVQGIVQEKEQDETIKEEVARQVQEALNNPTEGKES